MARKTQRDFLPTAISERNLDIIKVTDTVEASATIAAGANTTFTLTTASKEGVPIWVQEDISLFETSVAEANLIPAGSSVTPSHYQIIGPIRDQSSGDGNNIVSKIFVRNTTSTSATDSVDITTGGNFVGYVYSFRRKSVEISDGTLFTVYIDTSGGSGSYDLVYKTSTDNGATWSAATKIYDLTNTAGNTLDLVEVVKDGDDNLYICFDDAVTGTLNIVRFVKLTRSGSTWAIGSIINVAGGASNDEAQFGGVTMKSNGDLFIVYSYYDGTNNTIRSKISTDSGGTWGSDANLGSTNVSSKYPIIVLRDGNPFAIWHDFSDGKMYYSEYTTSWPAQTEAYDPTGNVTTWWSVCVDDSDNVHIAVLDNNSSPYEIEYLNYNGSSWSAEEDLAEGTNNDNTPILSTDGTDVYLHWIKADSGVTRGDLRRKKRSGGSWGSSSSLVNDEPKAFQLGSAERYIDSNFIHCFYVRGSDPTFGVEDKLIIYRDITGVSKTALFRGRTRYITPRDDVTIE